MRVIKNLIRKYFSHFVWFYTYIRHRIFISLGLSIAVGTLDGFGLAMFLPLLQMVDGSTDAGAMGNLRFIVDGMDALGIGMNLSSVMAVMLFFFILKGIAKFIEAWYKVIIQRYFIKKLRFVNIDHLNAYGYKAFVMADAGRIQNTISGEIGRITNAYKSYFNSMQAMIMVLVYVGLALLANAQFAFLVVVGGILSNQVYRVIYRRTKEASRKLTKGSNKFQGLLIQQVAFFKYLKATALDITYSRKLKDTILSIEATSKKMGIHNAILGSTKEPLVILVVVGVVLVQVNYFSQSLGLILLSLLFFYRSLTYLMNLQVNWNSFLQASGSLENMTAFLEELKEGRDRNGKIVMTSFSQSLELRDVRFFYGQSEVLKNINLGIEKNETIAFVGESGSGKTTLINILAGLMPVDSGEFLIDGQNASNLDIKSYRKRIGYITQDPVVFSDTIYNNVTFWAERIPDNETRFWESLEKAHIFDFVKALPNRENSHLGNNGILVSGGQKQRISIARELYKKSEILIMDEATSALDSETEKQIQTNIESLKGKYTILIVAHRLSTIKHADRIVLLKNGSIAQIGTFEDLKRESDIFERMVALQDV